MPKRRSAAKPSAATDAVQPTDPAKPANPANAPHSVRPPLPSTTRTYGKVFGSKGGKPLVPKAFSHRKRG